MALKTLISIVLAGGALVLGVQVASAGEMSDSSDRATLSQPGRLALYPDAVERAVATRLNINSSSIGDAHGRGAAGEQAAWSAYRDAFERFVTQKQGPVSSVSSYRDSVQRAPLPGTPVAAPTISSGREIEWPQLGIGFGIGMVFVLGLILAVRLTRGRPLAHG